MSLDSTLREISDGLKSNRVTERKKNAENLKELLNRNAVPSLLTENTNNCSQRGYSWNNLFDDINDYIFKETEKFETSKTFDNTTRPLCATLLNLCVSGANKGRAYITCDKITDACLFILKDKRLTKAVGDAYLNLLYKQVLSHEHYLGFITPAVWEDLLDVCLSSCISSHSKLDDFTKLRLVLLVMKNATNYCQFVIQLRDSLTKWKKCFYKVVNDKKAQEVVVEITILLLETLSAECRLLLCHFMESILIPILKCYEQNMDYKKKTSLFHVLHLVVALHHPKGRSRYQEGSLADDWTTWNKQLNSILEIICLEVTYLQRTRILNDDNIAKCLIQFHRLAAAVYFQVFQNTESLENEGESSAKKLKWSFNKNKTIGDLIDELQQNHMPWLGIIHIYIKNNYSTLSIDDYIALNKAMEGLLTSNINWEIYEELSCTILSNLKMHSDCRVEECVNVIHSLWNTFVRNSTTQSSSHKAIHNIMQYILNLNVLTYQHAQSLFKFYVDKGMPVTSHSVATLSILFHKFFNKYSYVEFRNNCFSWLIQGDIYTVDVTPTKQLLQRLISNDNMNIPTVKNKNVDDLHNVLFDNEKCMLFSDFELELKSPEANERNASNPIETNTELVNLTQEYFKNNLKISISNLNTKKLELLDFMKIIHCTYSYCDIILKSNIRTEQIKDTPLFCLLKTGLKLMYSSLDQYLTTQEQQIHAKIRVLHVLKEMFLSNADKWLSTEVRLLVPKELFITMNKIVIAENVVEDDDVVYADDERETNSTSLKHNCILVLAAYCTRNVTFRDELLNFILDPKIYDFANDTNCIFQSLDLLNDYSLQERPTALMVTLMQYMCKNLYRNPKATYLVLKNLIKMLNSIWASEGAMKQNCLIMIRGYVQRCDKMHYPPRVASLIYECMTKIIKLNREYNEEEIFVNILIEKVKGNIHSLRLYCCYLIKQSIFSEEELDLYLAEVINIFIIDVTEKHELIMKDELTNRTLTVLHCFLSITQTQPTIFQKLFINLLQIQKDKKLNETLVSKVIKKLANTIGLKNLNEYINKNIVSILYTWFLKHYGIEELPVRLMGYASLDVFKESHKKWVISADMLWRKGGDLRKCCVSGQTAQSLIEDSFCHIFALCLPYLVTEKYNLNYMGNENFSTFKKSTESAQKMFQLTGHLLESEKWTNLFVENVGELVLLNATHLCDEDGARQMFQVVIPQQTRMYCYPKNIFNGILDYFGDLNDGSIIQYLCENQPLAVYQILFHLWKTVLDENVFELKVLALHAFITFIEVIPLDLPSDAFICNFACKSFTHRIQNCSCSKEMKVLTKGVKMVIERFMPDKVHLFRKSVSHLLTTLVIKKEEGFESECKVLFDYLLDMKHYLKDSEDVVDYVSSVCLSQGSANNVHCASLNIFMEKLKTYKTGFHCPSPETLSSLRLLLKNNKHYLRIMYDKMSPKGFSEDCGCSIIHQLVHFLNNILQSNCDEKIIIEASNCLSEIGTYDLRTLVTVSPVSTQKAVDMYPKLYMTCVVVKTLSEAMFDYPEATKNVAETLNSVLRFKEGIDALGLEQVNAEVLKSFLSNDGNKSFDVKINSENFIEYCADNFDGIFLKALVNNWIPNNNENHLRWLKEVTTTLLKLVELETNYFNSLLKVCALNPTVCQKILPPLVGLILYCSSESKYIEPISRHINVFFNYIWEQTFSEKFENKGDSSQIDLRVNSVLDIGHKVVIRYMLDVVDFIRLWKNCYKTRPLNKFTLEYDKVAWAATVADQNLAALYYGELWAVSKNDGVPPSSPEATTNLPGGEDMQHIFRQCYVSIGEMDAIDGCGTAHLTIDSEKRKHLMSTAQYSDVLLLHDIALSATVEPTLQRDTARALHNSGMHHLALQYIKSLPETDDLNNIKYDCLSFLGDWSEIVDPGDLEEKSKLNTCNPHSILKAYNYACLKDCLNVQVPTECENKLVLILNKAKMMVAKLCRGLNMENCQNVYKVVSKLHLFMDIEDYFSVRSNSSTLKNLLNKWEMDKLPKFNDFKHMECLISQRVLMLGHAAKTCGQLRQDIVSLQIQYAKLGLSNNRVQMAQRLLALVKKTHATEEVTLVESEISWAKGHKEIALSLLRNIVSKDSQDINLTARSQRQYALWMAESKRDNARDIIDKYLLKSLRVLERSDYVETRLKVYHDIAKFADAEYRQVVLYMNSSVFENKVKVMESLRGTASSLRSTQHSLTRDEKKVLIVNERFKELDEVEIANTRTEKESFLKLAMKYYLLSLKECEENNLSVFRVISLWLDNPCFTLDGSERSFEILLHSIPSRKFISVLPQLAPRLTNDDTPFANNLRKILKRCALEHPHHTLPILFGLKNSDKDKLIMNASNSKPKFNAQEPRVVAATKLVQEVADTNKRMALIVLQMEKICDATISFANYKPTGKELKQKIPSTEQIQKLKNLDAIPIPTVTIPISNDCKYTDFPSLKSFDDFFELVGGINCPKKLSCVDSRGKKRILLVKGEDDMRQDAVMQQVFTIFNTLLKNNPVTSRNKLLIRTYKVVPMSKQSAVLEWCVGTIPLGSYLTGTGMGNDGAHSRYRPQDMTCLAARKLLSDYHKAGKSNKEKLAVYMKILRDFKPVFHFFFTEHYHDPVTWYERRLAYTKSVATSSMVGYILGLGDRHVQNILIDKVTAEVVHIDFGIAFDQGKTLQTPETVPFRLTQDMVAGFGSSGVEGIFRRCCEKTMQLLRDNTETLLTILEVLLCDPLYSWTVATAQQNRDASIHGMCGGNSGLAERALLAVSSKLSGTEGGAAGGVAVPGQVARLLHSAVDPVNLCRLFPGWQPYL